MGESRGEMWWQGVADEAPHGADEVAQWADEVPHGADEVAQWADEVPHGAQEVAQWADEVPRRADEVAQFTDEVVHRADEVAHWVIVVQYVLQGGVMVIFAIFEKLHVSADQVYFQEVKLKKSANFTARGKVFIFKKSKGP